MSKLVLAVALVLKMAAPAIAQELTARAMRFVWKSGAMVKSARCRSRHRTWSGHCFHSRERLCSPRSGHLNPEIALQVYERQQ
jgi:hypothetical protein